MLQTLKTKAKRSASTLAAGVFLFSQLAVVPIASATPADPDIKKNRTPQPNQIENWCSSSATTANVMFDITKVGTYTKYPISITVDKDGVSKATSSTQAEIKKIIIGSDEGKRHYSAPFAFPLGAAWTGSVAPPQIHRIAVCYDDEPIAQPAGGNQSGPQQPAPDMQSQPKPGNGSIKVSKMVKNERGIYVDSNGSKSPFRWGLDSQPTATFMGDTKTNVPAGMHTVTENTVPGFEFVGWFYTGEKNKSCNNPQGTTLPVKVTVKKNSTHKITLCNKPKKGSITVVKDAQPDTKKKFEFMISTNSTQHASWAEKFWLTGDEGQSSSKTFSDLLPTTYVIQELTGKHDDEWDLKNIVCSKDARVVIDRKKDTATVTLSAGQDVTCTFINQKKVTKGKIIVHKHTHPEDTKTKFDITATTHDGTIYGDKNRKIAGGETETYDVSYGTYSVDETMPKGWTQIKNTCKDIVITRKNPTAECHIHNKKSTSLTIVKRANPNTNQSFEFTSKDLGDFALIDNGSGDKNHKTFDDVDPGTHWITEENTLGWLPPRVYCDNDNYNVVKTRTLKVTLKPGQHVTCYFINNKQNTVTGHKFDDKNGNGAWDEGEPALAGWTIKLTKTCDAKWETPDSGDNRPGADWQPNKCEPIQLDTQTNASGAYTFANLTPGMYTVCEEQKQGWTQTYPQDNNGCHKLHVKGPGETVTANFGNKAEHTPQVLGTSTRVHEELVKTGASASVNVVAGLTILGALGALHVLVRRKNYSN